MTSSLAASVVAVQDSGIRLLGIVQFRGTKDHLIDKLAGIACAITVSRATTLHHDVYDISREITFVTAYTVTINFRFIRLHDYVAHPGN